LADTIPGCGADGGNGGERWQDLYACYFGPSGAASCTFSAGCSQTSLRSKDTSRGSFAFVLEPLHLLAVLR
jgi:hypothetical protein